MMAFIPNKQLMNSYVMKSGILYAHLENMDEMDYVKQNGITLSDYLQKQKYYDAQTKQVDTTFFCKNFGGEWDESGLDDISVLGTIIPLDQTQIIELEDPFIVCQKILRQCGIKEGTPFDFKRVLLNYYYYSQLDKRKILEALKSSQTEWER